MSNRPVGDVREGLNGLTIEDLPRNIRSKIRVHESGCWLWAASLGRGGYGQVWFNSTMARSHRVVYTLLVGPIPEGLEADHLCRVRHCVNPNHLEPVTRAENQRRRRKHTDPAARQRAYRQRRAQAKRDREIEAGGWVQI